MHSQWSHITSALTTLVTCDHRIITPYYHAQKNIWLLPYNLLIYHLILHFSEDWDRRRTLSRYFIPPNKHTYLIQPLVGVNFIIALISRSIVDPADRPHIRATGALVSSPLFFPSTASALYTMWEDSAFHGKRCEWRSLLLMKRD